ncbi:tweek [Carabus blaptoides fortunei]
MDQVNSTVVPGSKAKFTVDLPQHLLSFTTKLQATETNLLAGSTCVRRVLDQDVPQTEGVFHSSVSPATVTLALSAAAAADARHHRHRQRALCQVAGLQLSTVHRPKPLTGTVLGGTIELREQNISLACFHGINFKSKSWALFSLKEPCISYNTEAQEIPSSGPEYVQNTPFHGHRVQGVTEHHLPATVQDEWKNGSIMHSPVVTLMVDRFPSLERERPDNSTTTNSIERARSAQCELQDTNHTREIIFALPSQQLHLKTEHLQTAGTPDGTSDKPTVECSFTRSSRITFS